jgi:hypothetical protein
MFATRVADREVLYYYLTREEGGEKPDLPVTTVGNPKDKDSPGTSQEDNQQTVIESARNSEDFISAIERNTAVTPDNGARVENRVMVTTDSGAYDSDASVLIIDEETGEIEEKIVYMDPGFSVDDTTDLLDLETGGNDARHEEPDARGNAEPVEGTGASVQELQARLIDEFIMANPRIEPVKEKTHVPIEDRSKPSTEDSGGFVTETLARIYTRQGYYSKAIDIYERLSLKFPEKKIYFAMQIESVKNLIKK